MGHEIGMRLNTLWRLRKSFEAEEQRFNERRAAILQPVQSQLDALDAQYRHVVADRQREADALEIEIKNLVLELRQTVRGDHLMAVYKAAGMAWDDEALANYARAGHQEILKFRRDYDASVVIVKSKQK